MNVIKVTYLILSLNLVFLKNTNMKDYVDNKFYIDIILINRAVINNNKNQYLNVQ